MVHEKRHQANSSPLEIGVFDFHNLTRHGVGICLQKARILGEINIIHNQAIIAEIDGRKEFGFIIKFQSIIYGHIRGGSPIWLVGQN